MFCFFTLGSPSTSFYCMMNHLFVYCWYSCFYKEEAMSNPTYQLRQLFFDMFKSDLGVTVKAPLSMCKADIHIMLSTIYHLIFYGYVNFKAVTVILLFNFVLTHILLFLFPLFVSFPPLERWDKKWWFAWCIPVRQFSFGSKLCF